MNQLQRNSIPEEIFQNYAGFKFLMIICCMFFLSCSHYYYCPNSNNTPLLGEDEAKINLQFASADAIKAVEVQSAFAVSKHFGGMINAIAGGGNDDDDLFAPDGDKGSGKYIEVAAGYFTPLNQTPWIFETYAGAGTGGIKNNFGSEGQANVTFTKLFIQPNFGYKTKGFEFGLSSRFSLVNHKLKYSTRPQDDMDLLTIMGHPNSFLWEPGIVVRAGAKDFLVQIQYTASLNINNPDLVQQHGIFNIGFCIPIYFTPSDPLVKP